MAMIRCHGAGIPRIRQLQTVFWFSFSALAAAALPPYRWIRSS
jgi:hypothetical protein